MHFMKFTSCAALVLAAASVASADSFTVNSVPTTTTDFGYISPSTPYLLAIDLAGSGEKINGVTFTTGGATGDNGAGVSYTLAGPALTAYNGGQNFDAGASDPGVENLLKNFYYGGTNRNEAFSVSGLTPGDIATITLDSSAYGAGSTSGREESVGANSGDAPSIVYEENNGALSTLTYTAVVPFGGTLGFASAATDARADTLHYYGFTVSQAPAPEPATLGTLGVAALGLLARRRRA